MSGHYDRGCLRLQDWVTSWGFCAHDRMHAHYVHTHTHTHTISLCLPWKSKQGEANREPLAETAVLSFFSSFFSKRALTEKDKWWKICPGETLKGGDRNGPHPPNSRNVLALAHTSKRFLHKGDQRAWQWRQQQQPLNLTHELRNHSGSKKKKKKKKGGFGFGRYQCRLPYLGPTLLECLRLRR